MTVAEASAAIRTWTTEERLELLDELWMSLERDHSVPRLTPEMRTVLDERIAHADAHPDDVMTWDEMKFELRHERGQR